MKQKKRQIRLAAFLAVLSLMLGVLSGCGDGGEKTAPAVEEGTMVITFLNVGKADAILIRDGESAVMIDTGTADTAEEVCAYLKEAGVEKLDALILSHFDQDHVGGAAAILNTFEVAEVYTTWYEAKTSDEIDAYHEALVENGLSAIQVSDMFSLTIGQGVYTFDPPASDDYSNDLSNNSSLVVKLEFEGRSVLFTGDAEKQRIKELLKTDGLEAEIIKMPHHGGVEDNLGDLLDLVGPEAAVITSSDEEPEDAETLSLLEERGIMVFLTREGTIDLVLSASGYSFEQ